MGIQTVRRIASKIVGAGKSRIKIVDSSKVSEGVTRDDVKGLIAEKAIIVKPEKTNSRVRARKRHARKSVRSTGQGKRRGTSNARMKSKDKWMIKVRAQRKYLKELQKNKKIKDSDYRRLYLMVKGNYFRSKRHMEEYINGK